MDVSNEAAKAPGAALERPSDVLSAHLRPAAIQTSLGENDNALGSKALRQAHHPRVLTSLVLICWMCIFKVSSGTGTTLEKITGEENKIIENTLGWLHITPGH